MSSARRHLWRQTLDAWGRLAYAVIIARSKPSLLGISPGKNSASGRNIKQANCKRRRLTSPASRRRRVLDARSSNFVGRKHVPFEQSTSGSEFPSSSHFLVLFHDLGLFLQLGRTSLPPVRPRVPKPIFGRPISLFFDLKRPRFLSVCPAQTTKAKTKSRYLCNRTNESCKKNGSYLPSHQYNTGFSRKTNKKIVLYELFSGQIIYSSGNKIIFAIF